MNDLDIVGKLLTCDADDFLELAYINILRRSPDEAGVSYYLEKLRSGVSRLEVLEDLINSAEFGRLGRGVCPEVEEVIENYRSAKKMFTTPLKRRQSVNVLSHRLEHTLFQVKAGYDKAKAKAISEMASQKNANASVSYYDLVAGSIYFDKKYYCEKYPDVHQSGVDPVSHFVEQGWREERDPSNKFSIKNYLANNEDVREAGINPLVHYIIHGAKEGRRITCEGSNDDGALFDGVYEDLIYSEPLAAPEVKLIAFYLPQFHPIPENDKWWGKGFTEWTNVTRAKPFYVGHEQPRLPGELGFYDLRLVEILKRQAELAVIHGVFGFCFYVYWFDGKRLLEKPIEILLNNPDIDINFCYCWANENWTRRWDGLEQDILIGQSHTPQDDLDFIKDISTAFSDKRYIRINGKPLLILYRPALLPDCKATVQRWRKWCFENGFGEIYICFTESFSGGDPRVYGMDAAIEFPPLTNGPHLDVTDDINLLDAEFTGRIYEYSHTVENAMGYKRPDWTHFRAVMPSWDNTARKMERGFSFIRSNPTDYATWLNAVTEETRDNAKNGEKLVFVNAWNEWAEGAYLEPDRRRGYAYLNRTREIMAKYAPFHDKVKQLAGFKSRSSDISVIVHLHYLDLFDVISNYIDKFIEIPDLFFSVREGAFSVANAVIKEKYPNAVVVSYRNHGRDILPFMKIFSHVKDFGYKAICKIHSKKSKHRQDGDVWRDDVLGKLIGNSEAINNCIKKINFGAGIVSPSGHLLHGSTYWGSNAKRVSELARKMGCDANWVEDFVFPAGSMFWFSPKALLPLFKLELSDVDFEREAGQVDGTTAHAIERLFGLSSMKAGMTVVDTDGNSRFDDDYLFAKKS